LIESHLLTVSYEYDPGGARGTRSPPATPHCLQNPKWVPGGPKWLRVFGKGFNHRLLGAPRQLSLNRFFHPSTLSMKKVAAGKNEKENNGQNSCQ